MSDPEEGHIDVTYHLDLHWVGGDEESYQITRHALARLTSTGRLTPSVATGTARGPLHIDPGQVRMWRAYKKAWEFREQADYHAGYGGDLGEWYTGYKEVPYEPYMDSEAPNDPTDPEPATDNPLSCDEHYDDPLN